MTNLTVEIPVYGQKEQVFNILKRLGSGRIVRTGNDIHNHEEPVVVVKIPQEKINSFFGLQDFESGVGSLANGISRTYKKTSVKK